MENFYPFLEELSHRFVSGWTLQPSLHLSGLPTIERMGIAEGLEQGLIQGRREGERSLILRLLTRRIGVVPADLTLRIEQLSIDQLEALADALLDFSQVDDLVSWLAIPVPAGVTIDRY